MAEYLLIATTIYGLGTLTAAGTGVLLWRYRERTGALALLAMMVAMIIWNGCLFLVHVIEHSAISILLLRILFVGVALVTVSKFVFVLEYTGREHLIRPKILVPVAIPAVMTVFFAFVNPGNLYFESLEIASEGVKTLTVEFGPAALVPVLYAYTLNLVLTVLILGFIYRSRAVYRGQSLALLGGTMATWVANAVFVMNVVEFDVTAVGSVVSGILFTIAITRYRLLDLMPIARDRVLDNVNDGVFVIDGEDRLVDVNPMGREMLARIGVDDDELVGRSFPALLPHEEVRRQYETETEVPEERVVEVPIGENHFQVTATPIDDGRGRHVGWLLVAHDVTERKRREAQLQRQNQRLERFASLVSHDLRNPLNVADGYLELAFETDDDEEYLEEIDDSYDRMETIIEDVLALAREGKGVTDPEPVALDSVAEEAWDGVDSGSASLSIDADGSIIADSNRLRRLLENLYRNAVERGSEREDGTDLAVRVETMVESADGSVEGFAVEDDGVGIPARRRERVLEDGYTTGEEGTGLGLSIVESIASAHGWSVGITESEDGGARFEFTGVDTAGDGSDGTDSSASTGSSAPSKRPPPSS